MTGNKPMPTALKILRGTAKQAEKLHKRQIETPGAISEAPEWLTPEQKADWDYAVANAPREVLRRIDKAVLAAFVVAQDTHRRASMGMQTTQLLVKTPTPGLPMQNPYLPIVNRQAVLMTRIASELGFTPCSRARIDNANVTPGSGSAQGWDDISRRGMKPTAHFTAALCAKIQYFWREVLWS